MSDPTAAFFCSNHFGVSTSRCCADCGRPFCDSCLTELAGTPLCGWCRDYRLSRLQPQSCNPAAVVLWARIFDGVALLLGSGITVLYAAFFAFPFFAGLNAGIGRGGASSATSQTEFQVTVVMAAVIMLFSAVVYLPPAIGLGPRRAWLWTWQMATLVLSVIGGCILLGSVGMLLVAPAAVLWIYWVKPEVRRYCEEG